MTDVVEVNEAIDKPMTETEAQLLTDRCSKQADQYLKHLVPMFANREKEFGSGWAIENYVRMALLPGIFALRSQLTDEGIKDFMPVFEKMVLNYEISKEPK